MTGILADTVRPNKVRAARDLVLGGFDARVFCLLTQEGEQNHGAKSGKATITNVNHCPRRLQRKLEKGEIKSIALPRLATGVGGLDWADVFPLIQSHCGELQIPVFVYPNFRMESRGRKSG